MSQRINHAGTYDDPTRKAVTAEQDFVMTAVVRGKSLVYTFIKEFDTDEEAIEWGDKLIELLKDTKIRSSWEVR